MSLQMFSIDMKDQTPILTQGETTWRCTCGDDQLRLLYIYIYFFYEIMTRFDHKQTH